jgi:hypothetical protein
LHYLSYPATRHYTVRQTSFQQKKADFVQQFAGAKSNKIMKYKIRVAGMYSLLQTVAKHSPSNEADVIGNT